MPVYTKSNSAGERRLGEGDIHTERERERERERETENNLDGYRQETHLNWHSLCPCL